LQQIPGESPSLEEEDYCESSGIEDVLSDSPHVDYAWEERKVRKARSSDPMTDPIFRERMFDSGLAASPGTSDRVPGTHRAVLQGLTWLKKHQGGDGSWSSIGFQALCDGIPCPGIGEGSRWKTTGLALLAFLGEGCTRTRGPFRSTVRRALKFLVDHQGTDGSFGGNGGTGEDLEAQAVCAVALAEAHARGNRGPLLRRPARLAAEFLVSRQIPGSGWGRGSGGPCDARTTAWALFALHAMEIAGLDVPHDRAMEPEALTEGAADLVPEESSGARNGNSLAPQEAEGGVDLERVFLALISSETDDDARMIMTAGGIGGLIARQGKNGCLKGSWSASDLPFLPKDRVQATALCTRILERFPLS
jgi:hypothetical protein